MKNIVLLLFLTLIFSNAIAQVEVAAPEELQPNEEDKIFIDSIIMVTGYEDYFYNIGKIFIERYAQLNKWNKNKTNKTVSDLDFYYFKRTIYNLFAQYKSDELRKIIYLFQDLNKGNSSWKLLITDEMVESNLNVYLNAVIQGKYKK